MRSVGLGLAGAVRLENRIPNRLLRADVPVRGAQQRETPTFSVDGVLSGRERDVAALPLRRSQMAKPMSLSPLSGPASASKTTSASASFPGGLLLVFGSDPDRHDFCVLLGHKVLLWAPLSETTRCGEVRADPEDAADEGGTHDP